MSFIVILLAIIAVRVGWGLYKRKNTQSAKKVKQPKGPMGPWKRQYFTVMTFAKISVLRYFRDKTALFFTVLFPLIFLFVFGSFSKGGNNISFHIGLINQSSSQFSQQFAAQIKDNKMFKVDETVTGIDEAKDKMSRSEIDATLVLPPGFGDIKNGQYPSGQALIYYNPVNEQAAQTISTVLQGEFQDINSKFVKVEAPFTVKSQSTNTRGLTALDYTVSGLIGFSIIGLGIFGPVNYFPQMKKQGVLRRLHITPLRTWQFFISSVLSNALIGLFSIAVMIVVASVAFNFTIVGSYIELALFISLGILTIFGIGLAIGGWAKNENQAAPLSNIIVFPMLFLSGTFFPRFGMPEWLQNVSAYLPLTPIIDGIRMIATEGKHLTEIGPQIGLTLIWAVIIYAIAFRVFRWE
jgi:ABC-2 type transport system permease protein